MKKILFKLNNKDTKDVAYAEGFFSSYKGLICFQSPYKAGLKKIIFEANLSNTELIYKRLALLDDIALELSKSAKCLGMILVFKIS